MGETGLTDLDIYVRMILRGRRTDAFKLGDANSDLREPLVIRELDIVFGHRPAPQFANRAQPVSSLTQAISDKFGERFRTYTAKANTRLGITRRP
jgi:hypothetical protein